MKMIPKVENTSEHKYDQRYGQSDAVRAIKAIQSTIRPVIRSERSKRLEEYNQSDMVRDTIRTNPGVVTLSVAFRRRPQTQAEA